MIIVDASVLVAALWTQDTHHDASRRWLRVHVLGDELLMAPRLLWAEVAGAIARRSGDARLGYEAAEYIYALGLAPCPFDRTYQQLATTLAAKLQLRGADALYVAAAAHFRGPLVTWDREQLERGGQLVQTYRPDQH